MVWRGRLSRFVQGPLPVCAAVILGVNAKWCMVRFDSLRTFRKKTDEICDYAKKARQQKLTGHWLFLSDQSRCEVQR